MYAFHSGSIVVSLEESATKIFGSFDQCCQQHDKGILGAFCQTTAIPIL